MKSELVKEVWKPVPGYESLYDASNYGRIRSMWYEKVKIIKPQKVKGYLRVNLCKDGKRKNFYVHRLVAMAFIPNPDNLPMINHKDECKTNNIPENLEWCDVSYNNSYGTLPERQSQNQLNNPITSKTVYQYTLDGVLVRVWPSAAEAGRNGFKTACISLCCNGKLKTHKGFLWSYTPLN